MESDEFSGISCRRSYGLVKEVFKTLKALKAGEMINI